MAKDYFDLGIDFKEAGQGLTDENQMSVEQPEELSGGFSQASDQQLNQISQYNETEQVIQDIANEQQPQETIYSEDEFFGDVDKIMEAEGIDFDTAYDETRDYYISKGYSVNGYEDEFAQPIQEEEQDKQGFDLGLNVGEGISEFGKDFKFDSNVDDGIIESGLKFIGNLPGNTAQLAGDLISIFSNPVGTVQSMNTLAKAGIESSLNKIFLKEGEEVFTSDEVKQVADIVGKEMDKLGDEGRIKELLVENPTDVLLTITGGLGIAKNIAKSKGLTSLVSKLEKAEKLTNPITIQKNIITKTPGIVAEGVKLPFKLGAKTLRAVTPEGVSKAIAGIDKDTSNILKTTKKADLEKVLAEAEASVNDIGNVPSPFAKAGKKAEDVLDLIRNKKSNYGAEKSSILNKVANKTIKTKSIQNDFNKLIADRFNLQINPKTLKLQEIPGKVATIDNFKELQGLTDNLLEVFTRDKIDLGNLDALVDKLQDTINYNKVPGKQASKVEKTIKGFIESNINYKLKDVAGEKFVNANNRFREMLDLENGLSKLLGKDGNKVEGLMKTIFSPQTGERTAKVFRKIKDEFGIDLIKESKLAKFAMETVGDNRAYNLLKALDLGPGFANNKTALIQKALQSVYNVEDIAKSLTIKEANQLMTKLKKGVDLTKKEIDIIGQSLKEQALEKGGKLADDLADKVGARAKFIDDSGKSLDDFSSPLIKEAPYITKMKENAKIKQDFKIPKKLYRGVAKEVDKTKRSEFGFAQLGKGLYTTPDKSFAKQYGKVIEFTPTEAFPKNPLVIERPFGPAPQALKNWLLDNTGINRISEFHKLYGEDYGKFLKELGYDGVYIGDEVVKY